MYPMREVTVDEYLEFIGRSRRIEIEDQAIELEPINVRRLEPLELASVL